MVAYPSPTGGTLAQIMIDPFPLTGDKEIKVG